MNSYSFCMYVVIPMFVTGPEFGHSTHIDLLENKDFIFSAMTRIYDFKLIERYE